MCRPDDYPPFTSVEVAALRAVVEFEPNTERVIEDDEVRATIQTVFGLTTDEIARAIAVADMHDPHWRDGPLAAARAAAPPVERVKRGALAECECVPGHYCDCRDLRSLLHGILMNVEYAKMEAEGLAADALGLRWSEQDGYFIRDVRRG